MPTKDIQEALLKDKHLQMLSTHIVVGWAHSKTEMTEDLLTVSKIS